MSGLAFGKEHGVSNVHVYGPTPAGGYVCAECLLKRAMHHEDDAARMLGHLGEHLWHGHKVPNPLIETLNAVVNRAGPPNEASLCRPIADGDALPRWYDGKPAAVVRLLRWLSYDALDEREAMVAAWQVEGQAMSAAVLTSSVLSALATKRAVSVKPATPEELAAAARLEFPEDEP